MATHTYSTICIPEAQRFADLTGIKYDLSTALEIASKLLAKQSDTQKDYALLDALTAALVVRYCRPFVTGVRSPLGKNETEAALDNQQVEMHEWMRKMRDKHIAHSVNTFEESQPVARFCLETIGIEGVYSVECNHARTITLDTRKCRQIIEMINLLLTHVEKLIEHEKALVLAIVRKIPVDQLLRQRKNDAMMSSLRHVADARKKFE